MTETQDNYFSRYWQKNSVKVNKKRKQRYDSDPDYAEKARQAARDYRKRKKEEILKEREEAGEPLVKKGGGPRKPKEIEVNGAITEAVTIGTVASEIGVSVQKLNYWRKIGILPQTPLESESGEMLYTYGMVEAIKRTVSGLKRVTKKDKWIYNRIKSIWRMVGVVVDEG